MRPLRADEFQPSDAPAPKLAEARESRIKAAVLAALRVLASAFTADEDEVEAAVRRYDAARLSSMLNVPAVQDAMANAYAPIADTRIESAQDEADRAGPGIVFDSLTAAGILVPFRAAFAQRLTDEAGDTIRQQLLTAFRAGLDPDDAAAQLSRVIGLTDRQAQAVNNYRNALLQGDRQALRNVLRDKRFDATVENWINGADQVDPEKVEAMVERYAARQLAFRAETIARTESMQAAVGGVRDAYVQSVNSGRLLQSEVRRRWRVEIDERTCPVCISIPILNPNGVGIFEPYLSIQGPIMAPLAHARCRCDELYTANLSRIAGSPWKMAA